MSLSTGSLRTSIYPRETLKSQKMYVDSDKGELHLQGGKLTL